MRKDDKFIGCANAYCKKIKKIGAVEKVKIILPQRPPRVFT